MIRVMLAVATAGCLAFGAPSRADDGPAATTPTTLARSEPPALAALIDAHRTHDEAAVARAEAALAAGGAEALPALREALERERPFNVKVSLELVIRRIEGRASARSIVEAMRAARPNEKILLASVLGRVDATKELDYLRGELERESDPLIKRAIVRAASLAEARAGLRSLVKVAASDPDREVRIEAIRALERWDDPEVEEAFLRIAPGEEDASIRSILVRALASAAGESARPFFLETLERDERTFNRGEAARYFARVGTPGDLTALRALQEREKTYYVRQKIAQAIQAIERRTAPAPVEKQREPTLF